MKADGSLRLRIEGHADARGTTEHNEELAARRAENVAERFRRMGIERERIEVLSFGERVPVRRGHSARDLARNRRVELLLIRRMPKGGWAHHDC